MIRRAAIAAGFLLLLALVARPVRQGLDQWHFGQGYDDSVYFVTAKALATGQGYHVLSLPGQPFAVKYPPLYPLFLSIAWRMEPDFPRNLRLAAAMQAALLPVFLALLLLVLRRFGLSWRRTFLVAATSLVTMQMVLITITLFSELLFLCLLLTAIVIIERSQEQDSKWLAVAGGVLTGLAYLTRNAALPMFGAVPLFYLIRGRFRLAGYFLGAALPAAVAWHGWVFLHGAPGADPTNGSYLNEYIEIIRHAGFWGNLLKHLSTLSATAAENQFPGILQFLLGLPFFHIVLIAAVAGTIRMGRRTHWPLYIIFSGLYLVMIVLWWFDGLGRLMAPVWPVLVAGLAQEVSFFADICSKAWAGQRWPRWALFAAGVLIMLRNENFTMRRISEMAASEQKTRTQDEQTFSWIAAHRREDTVVLAWKDSTSYLYTDTPASRGWFASVTHLQQDAQSGTKPSAAIPREYTRGMLVLLNSDLGDEAERRGLSPFRSAAESLPESRLEFHSQTGSVYSFLRR